MNTRERDAGSKTLGNLDPVPYEVRVRFRYIGVSDPTFPDVDDVTMTTAFVTVTGTPQTQYAPLTASFEGVPDEHDRPRRRSASSCA